MYSRNLICATAGIFLGVYTAASGQDGRPAPPVGPGRHAASPPGAQTETPDSANSTATAPLHNPFWQSWQFTGGQLTLPFKIRPKNDTRSFRLTTDVTVGAYVGITRRLSAAREYFLTIPLAAGLTFININDNNTSLDRSAQDAEVVPGLTWSTGLILQLDQYNLGLMFGKDYASEVGDQWEYHGRLWWSFGLGFTFFH